MKIRISACFPLILLLVACFPKDKGRDKYLAYVKAMENEMASVRLAKAQSTAPEQMRKKLSTGEITPYSFDCLLNTKLNTHNKKGGGVEWYYLSFDDEFYIELTENNQGKITMVTLQSSNRGLSERFVVTCDLSLEQLLL
ncbi:hypothetical protein FCV66_11405 [Enterovibrio norvegicus]|uniref:Lipoprotein n=2 Tax=Enterovibrio norvegicus TaxID=188144 RepID=A0ABV4KVU8_9GAMM|nr:hypothetical protein [Enterovibrio norvegicus]MCC4798580.1 hypothetical protein [Enterovibrio norvegicus]TKF14228.1 hypothetical protein FCV66_11405 [Enterovibrio norvegicus]